LFWEPQQQRLIGICDKKPCGGLVAPETWKRTQRLYGPAPALRKTISTMAMEFSENHDGNVFSAISHRKISTSINPA
jgi:hypothetical protein